MKTLKFPYLLILMFASCSTKSDKNKTESRHAHVDSSSGTKYFRSINSKFDTLTIDKKAAVFYSPDSNQIAKRKKEIGEETFYAGADDFLYYMHTSYDFLDSIKFPILDGKDKKFLKFIGSDKSETLIKLDTLDELWGIYLFDPGKKPKWVESSEIGDEFNNYFR